MLDTDGSEWHSPAKDLTKLPLNTPKINFEEVLSEPDGKEACESLAMNQNNNQGMLVPLPDLEMDEANVPKSIWLPFKRKHIYETSSGASAFILFQYFISVSNCYTYQGIDQSIFNRKLKAWLTENILPLINDEQFYPAFGAVLRVLETIREPNEKFIKSKKKKTERRRKVDAEEADFDLRMENFQDLLPKEESHVWIMLGLLAAGIALAILFFSKCCKLQIEKVKRVLWANSHHSEPDEFHQYTKDQPNGRSLAHLNEKHGKDTQKRHSRKANGKSSLHPISDSSDSEEVLFLKQPNAVFAMTQRSDGEARNFGSTLVSEQDSSEISSLYRKVTRWNTTSTFDER